MSIVKEKNYSVTFVGAQQGILHSRGRGMAMDVRATAVGSGNEGES